MGSLDGTFEGELDGATVGLILGGFDGTTDRLSDGLVVSDLVGATDGDMDGFFVGFLTQVLPSPIQPILQKQKNDDSVSTHSALMSHGDLPLAGEHSCIDSQDWPLP